MANKERFLSYGRIILIGAMIIAGIRVYSEMKPYLYVSNETNITQPDAAYDAILRGTLRNYSNSPQLAEHPTQQLRTAIHQLPRRDGILFLGSQQNPGHLALRLITGALSWPQPVFNPGCNDPHPGDPPPSNFKASGAIYYHASPPMIASQPQTILPEMVVTQAPENIEWKFYCPR